METLSSLYEKTGVPIQNLMERQTSAGSEHALDLSKQLSLVFDIHGDMLRIRTVESLVSVWKVLAIAVPETHGLLQSDKLCQFVCCIDKGFSDVDTVDVTLKTICQIPCRSA